MSDSIPSYKKPGFKKPSLDEIQKNLTPHQFAVTQKEGTEQPFKNEYWDNKKDGIYVDLVSGEPLFNSKDKYDSGSGWPSFTKPIDKSMIIEKKDRKLLSERIEIRSKHGDAHLGHVFDDGPMPAKLRYCVNSSSLRFIPKENLEKEGYGEFATLFATTTQATSKKATHETIILAGGCFWGMEDILRKVDGVISTQVGYTGGALSNPTYKDVKTGTTGHAEAIEVVFDPSKITLVKILDQYFFKMHDPTTLNRQGNDTGSQYRSGIFYYTPAQKEAAIQAKLNIEKSGTWKKPVVTEITKATQFYPAEDYHQDYLVKNPGGYTCHFLRD